MEKIPYYLNPSAEIDQTGSINIFHMDTLSSVGYEKSATSIWQEIGQDVNSAGDWVWDGVNGVWKSTKDAVESLGVAAGDAIKESYSFLKSELIFWLGAALLIIWIVAKSGILKQAAVFI